MKKPSFFKKCLIYVIIMLLTAGLCATGLVWVRKNNYEEEKTAEFKSASELLSRNIDEMIKYRYGFVKEAEFNAEMNYILAQFYNDYHVASKLYVNGKEAARSSDNAFALFPSGTRVYVYQIKDISLLKDFDEYSEMMYYDVDIEGDVEVRIGMSWISVSNTYNEFVPVHLKVMKINSNDKTAELIDYYEMKWTTQNTFVLRKQDDVNPVDLKYMIRMGDVGISENYSLDTVKSLDLNAVAKAISRNDNSAQYNTVLISSKYEPPEYFSTHKPEIIITYAAAAVISIALAFGMAYMRYTKERSIYDMVEYRRKTTNAMAHDLKTPLAAISAYSENLERNLNNEKREYYSKKIIENVGIMNKMIEEILQFSKSEEVKKDPSAKENVDLKDLIEETCNEVKPLFDDRRVILRVDPMPETVINTDRTLLKQALLNLLTNCARYSTPVTATTVSMNKGKVTITNYTDSVIEDVNKLKEPFVKGKNSRGEKEGTGLGLSIADNNLSMIGRKLELSFENGKFTARF